MHSSHFAGAVTLAGALLLFGCDQARHAENTNTKDKPVETAGAQTAGSTSQPGPGAAGLGSTPLPEASPESPPIEAPLLDSSGAAAPMTQQRTIGIVGGQPNIYLQPPSQPTFMPPENTENYLPIDSNPVKEVAQAPVSTFSVDVDSGSYANIRRFLMGGQKPPKDAVRVEELVNYFAYDYPAPDDQSMPFKTTTHVSRTPWNPDTYLL